uniref:Uncharacterized protein n=1 Tax=Anguilla anguilla TaxID=7936 RepID=A0A0E9W280_ANGAN
MVLEVNELDSAPEQVKPVVLRKTVCYIVCAVIINAKVMQSCSEGQEIVTNLSNSSRLFEMFFNVLDLSSFACNNLVHFHTI